MYVDIAETAKPIHAVSFESIEETLANDAGHASKGQIETYRAYNEIGLSKASYEDLAVLQDKEDALNFRQMTSLKLISAYLALKMYLKLFLPPLFKNPFL